MTPRRLVLIRLLVSRKREAIVEVGVGLGEEQTYSTVFLERVIAGIDVLISMRDSVG